MDWRFDPGILGMERATEFVIEFQIEKYVDCVSHLDLLLGERWDVRRTSGNNGYRAILTLEIFVDMDQFLKVGLVTIWIYLLQNRNISLLNRKK